jgi:hypothetical protein
MSQQSVSSPSGNIQRNGMGRRENTEQAYTGFQGIGPSSLPPYSRADEYARSLNGRRADDAWVADGLDNRPGLGTGEFCICSSQNRTILRAMHLRRNS